MAFSSNKSGGPMAEINVTPLVDVMLVLLIIFMITAPAVTNRILIDVPQKSTQPPPKDPPPPIDLGIRASGQLFWNGQPISMEILKLQIEFESKKNPQPVLQIQADDQTQYQVLADVMGTAKNVGYKKIGFASPEG
ncbi:MAG: biopolymer transporter ExbD [Rhodanobacteraceae bacterium]|nr:biopolymer transporter ExbD [Rhodanobacteraceae bacterium]